MNEAQLIGRLALCTQVSTAIYALRLNRLFGTERAGWALFGAFGLMVVMHLNQAWGAAFTPANYDLKPEFVHLTTSVLLLIGLTHVGIYFRERTRMEQAVRACREECEKRIEVLDQAAQQEIEALQIELSRFRRLKIETDARELRSFLSKSGSNRVFSGESISGTDELMKTQTVLVVEDESAVRELVCEILERQGCRVLQANSGQAALDLWRNCKSDIDLLVTDIVMPGAVNGWQLAETLKREKPTLKVICTSGCNSDEASLNLADQFLPKPYEIKQLVDAVQKCTGTGRSSRASG